jgi:plastocyanin
MRIRFTRAVVVGSLPAVLLLGAACSSSNNNNATNNSSNTAATKPATVVSTTVSTSPTVASTVRGTAVATVSGTAAPAGSPRAAGSPAAAAAGPLTETATDNKFSDTKVTAKAGQATTIAFANKGSAVHNLHVLNVQDAAGKDIKTDIIDGGKSASLTFTITKAGTYTFQCDVHPTEMTGTLTVS